MEKTHTVGYFISYPLELFVFSGSSEAIYSRVSQTFPILFVSFFRAWRPE
jgi:hypothetical protein